MWPPTLVARARRWMRAPALHFVAIGATLFAADAVLARPGASRSQRASTAASSEPRIVVDAAFVEGLRQEQVRRTGRAPTPDEERGLVERHVDEEVLYREALALGLDRGDVIVRRRLAQKMGFLLDATPAAEPTEGELQRWLDEHADRYREPAAISFRHVFVSADRHGARVDEEAAKVLDALRSGADPAKLGDPFLRGDAWSRRTPKEIEAVFGATFAGALAGVPTSSWSGPVRSSYGAHLVFVSERAEPRTPSLAAVRVRVREELVADRAEAARAAAVAKLRAHYVITVEAPPAPPTSSGSPPEVIR